jgi:hypothetical protein
MRAALRVIVLLSVTRAAWAAVTPEATSPANPRLERKEVGPVLDRVLADKRFGFCHDPKYPLTADELEWCAIAPAKDARCPAFREACAQGAKAELIERRRPIEVTLPTLPYAVGVVLWVLLGLVVALLIALIVRNMIGERPQHQEVQVEAGDDGALTAEQIRARIVETDVARLLERAAAAAAAGDYGDAMADTYAALLRKLEGADIVRVEAHRTNGDHVRDVGRKTPALRQGVSEVVRTVEEVEFGGAPPTADRYGAIRERVLAVVRAQLAPLASLLLLAGALLGLGGLAGCQSERASWDDSPSGRAAVLAFLKDYGFDARERITSLAKIDHTVDQLIVTPTTAVLDDGWKSLESWVASGGTLIAAGVDHLPPWIGVERAHDKVVHSSAPVLLDELAAQRFGRLRIVIPAGDVLKPSGDVPLVYRGSAPYAVERSLGDGRVIVLADDHLFKNASLTIADNARFVSELVRAGGVHVELAGELTGLAATTPLSSVKRGRLAPVLCQLFALTILFFLYKGAHFGRPVDPLSTARRAFSEHARSAGLQYAHARASRLALELYGAYAFERLRDRLNVGGGRSLSAMAEAVAARTGRPLGEVMRVLVEAREGVEQVGGGVDAAVASTPNDLPLLRNVATLVAETSAPRRGNTKETTP